MLLAPSSYYLTESATPGSGRGGAVGGGGAPLRYEYTAGGFSSFQPWNETSCAYSILQLYKGYNPLSKIEVVSLLNLFNQAHQMYAYSPAYCTERYYPKVYIGTAQTLGIDWNYDSQKYANKPIQKPSTWPQNPSQKGEANKKEADNSTSHFKINNPLGLAFPYSLICFLP